MEEKPNDEEVTYAVDITDEIPANLPQEVKAEIINIIQVATHNYLIRSPLSFSTAIEAKIFTLMISQITSDAPGYRPFQIRMVDLLGYDPGQKSYKQVRDAIDTLFKKEINVLKIHKNKRSKNDYHKVHIFSSLQLDTGTGYIRGNFTDEIRPYLFELSGYFTLADLNNLLSIRSGYTYKFYWLMRSYEYAGELLIEFEKFRKWVIGEGPDGEDLKKYTTWSDFRKFILEPALEAIEDLIKVVFHPPITKGKKVTHLYFTFDPTKKLEASKRSELKQLNSDPAQIDLFNPPPAVYSDPHQKIAEERLLHHQVPPHQVKLIMENYQGDWKELVSWIHISLLNKKMKKPDAHLWVNISNTWKEKIMLPDVGQEKRTYSPPSQIKKKEKEVIRYSEQTLRDHFKEAFDAGVASFVAQGFKWQQLSGQRFLYKEIDS